MVCPLSTAEVMRPPSAVADIMVMPWLSSQFTASADVVSANQTADTCSDGTLSKQPYNNNNGLFMATPSRKSPEYHIITPPTRPPNEDHSLAAFMRSATPTPNNAHTKHA